MQYVANPYEIYKEQGVMTASPIELIIMLYDGCIKNIRLAEIAINEKNLENCHKHLKKAQDIVTELINSLDMQYDISQQLLDLYTFMLNTLVEANLEKSAEKLPDVIEMLRNLKTSWEEVSKGNGSNQNLEAEK